MRVIVVVVDTDASVAVAAAFAVDVVPTVGNLWRVIPWQRCYWVHWGRNAEGGQGRGAALRWR